MGALISICRFMCSFDEDEFKIFEDFLQLFNKLPEDFKQHEETIFLYVIDFNFFILALILVGFQSLRTFFIEQTEIENNNDTIDLIKKIVIIPPIQKEHLLNNVLEIIHYFPPSFDENIEYPWSFPLAAAIYLTLNQTMVKKTMSFTEIHKNIINEYGTKFDIENFLSTTIPKYNLRFKKFDDTLCFRPRNCIVILCYNFNEIQWFNYKNFFNNPSNKNKVITSEIINKKPPTGEIRSCIWEKKKIFSILVDSILNVYQCMNYWKNENSDDGLFGISNDIECDYYKIYLNDLNFTQEEQNVWDTKNNQIIQSYKEIISNIDNLHEEMAKKVNNSNKKYKWIFRNCPKIVKMKDVCFIDNFDKVEAIVKSFKNDPPESFNDESFCSKFSKDQINDLITFVIDFLTINEVTKQFKTIAPNFWKQ